MDNKTLNALDGSSVLTEVMRDKVEAQRKSYKRAIKSAVIRNDKAQEYADKANTSVECTKAKLNALVDGGMEGFLATKKEDVEEDVEDNDSYSVKQAYRRPPLRFSLEKG